MKRKILNSIYIICTILLMLNIGLVNQVNAASSTTMKTESKIKQISLVNSPIISFDIDKEKLADVKMHVKDANGISEVKIFNITTGKNGSEITNKFNPKKISENEYVYTFSDKNFLKGGKVYLRIYARNQKNCYINMEFTVENVVNAENKKNYYGVNRAPTMINMKVGTSKFSFRALEFWGMEKFELQDVNNNNNVVFKRENLRKGSTDYSIKLADLKEGSDGMYKIKMIAKEAARNGEARTIYRTIKFRKALKDTHAPIEDVKPKLDKSTVVLEGKNFELLTVSNTGSKAISWKAEDDNIVDVVLKKNNIARIRAKKTGKTTVIARVGSEEIKCEVIVPEISPNKLSIMKGSSQTLKLNYIDTKKTVTYKSSNEKIATVDKNGKVFANGVGSATITATYEKKNFSAKITVIDPKLNKNEVVLNVNGTSTLKAIGLINEQAAWSTSNKNVAEVTKKGKNEITIKAKKAGRATITARVKNKNIKCEIYVPEINQEHKTMIVGDSTTIKLSNIDTKKVVKYESSNTNVATVDKNGKVLAKSTGSATITVTYEGKKYKSRITVMGKAAKDGYYYTTISGYRIYYKKSGNNYKKLIGLTDYTVSTDGKMYAETDEILKAIGYNEKNSDFRILIAADSKLENCTLTVLAKDENGKYTIPVKSNLCIVPSSAKKMKEITLNNLNKDITKLGGTLKIVDNGNEREGSWNEHSNKILAPGTMKTSSGYYQSLFYKSQNDHRVLDNNCYTEMGTAASAGSIRLYWQDLKWIYDNCKSGTIGVMLRTTKAFTPFGECTKIDPKVNKSQENPNYTLSDKYESKLKDNSFDGVTFYNVGSYDTGRRWDYTQAATYSDGYYYATTLINYENGKQGNSILKFDSNFKLVKKNTDLNVVDKNSKNKIHGNGIVVGENKNELLMGFNKTNRVRVYDTKTLKYVKEKKSGGIGSSTGALVYEPKNNLYIQAISSEMRVSKDGKSIGKITRPKGEIGQDICVVGDYIIETTYRESAVNIYSIKRGCRVKKAQIKFNDVTVPQNKNSSEWNDFLARFEPEGICAVSNNEFVIMVARFKHGDSTRHIDFYKATIK